MTYIPRINVVQFDMEELIRRESTSRQVTQEEYSLLLRMALDERLVTDKPVSIKRLRITSRPVTFECNPDLQEYK